MFVTIALAAISARSDIKPELLYVGTVWIDLMIIQIVAGVLGVTLQW